MSVARRFGVFRGHYGSLALIVLNTIVALVLANVGAAAVFAVRDAFRPADPVSRRYGGVLFTDEALHAVYPGVPLADVLSMLEETWTRPYVFEPFTQFKEGPFAGRYVNVHEAGFRFSGRAPVWPPDPAAFTVFLFGGSTAFGYGLPDHQTIAAVLQERLGATSAAVVYNFGRGDYYSTQERILFQSLLAAGHRPDIAVFLDGLNDFHYYTDDLVRTRFGQAFDRRPASPLVQWIRRWPLVRLAERLAPTSAPPPHTSSSGDVVTEVIERYERNQRMIRAVAAADGVAPLFVWQPVPAYRYDLTAHLFAEFGLFDMHPHLKAGYPAMAERRAQAPVDFAWCADLQTGLPRALYVDQAHYTAAFTETVAQCILDALQERRMVAGATAAGVSRP
jgi:hypothetical protein